MAKNKIPKGGQSFSADEPDWERDPGADGQIPHRPPGQCKSVNDHRLAQVGLVTVNGVGWKKLQCQHPGCNYETTGSL